MSPLIHRNLFSTAASAILFISSLVYIAVFFTDNFDKLERGAKIPAVSVLLLALMLTLVAHGWNSCLWWYSLRKLNTSVSVLGAYRSWTVSRLARYVPGKVFSYFVRIGLHSPQHRTGITIATVVELIGGVLATLIIALASLVYYRDELPSDVLFAVILLIPVCFLAIPVLIRVCAYVLKKMGTGIDLATHNLSLATVFKLAVFQLPLFFIHGAAFFVVLKGSLDIAWFWFLYVVTIYYFSGLLGQLAFFAPAGLGVREASLLVLLAPIVAEQVALFYSVIIIRLILISSEFVNAAIAVLLYRVIASVRADVK